MPTELTMWSELLMIAISSLMLSFYGFNQPMSDAKDRRYAWGLLYLTALAIAVLLMALTFRVILVPIHR